MHPQAATAACWARLHRFTGNVAALWAPGASVAGLLPRAQGWPSQEPRVALKPPACQARHPVHQGTPMAHCTACPSEPRRDS